MGKCVDLFAFFTMSLAYFNDRRGVLGECQGITTFSNQCFCCFFGLVRPVPGIDPFHVHGGIGVDGLGTKGIGVDVADQFRNGVGGNITKFIGFGQYSCHHTVEVVHLIQIAKIGAQVGATFEPCAMHKFCIRIFFSGFDGVIHVSETGGEDHIAFLLLDKTIHDSQGIRFSHRFNNNGFQPRIERFNIPFA